MSRTDFCMLAMFIYMSPHLGPMAGLGFGVAFGALGLIGMLVEKK